MINTTVQYVLAIVGVLVAIARLVDTYLKPFTQNGHVAWADAAYALKQELKGHAKDAVIHLEHTMVRNFMDPDMPGTWDQKAKLAVRDEAVRQVGIAGASVTGRLHDLGYTKDQTDLMTLQNIEEAVVQTKIVGAKDLVGRFAKELLPRLADLVVSSSPMAKAPATDEGSSVDPSVPAKS